MSLLDIILYFWKPPGHSISPFIDWPVGYLVFIFWNFCNFWTLSHHRCAASKVFLPGCKLSPDSVCCAGTFYCHMSPFSVLDLISRTTEVLCPLQTVSALSCSVFLYNFWNFRTCIKVFYQFQLSLLQREAEGLVSSFCMWVCRLANGTTSVPSV